MSQSQSQSPLTLTPTEASLVREALELLERVCTPVERIYQSEARTARAASCAALAARLRAAG